MSNKLTLGPDVWKKIEELRITSLNGLAPKFKNSILAAIDDMRGRNIKLGPIVVDLDWYVFETLRTEELQQIYYLQGTTNAKTAARSWHKYGLAVDGISGRFRWFNNPQARIIWPNKEKRELYAALWFLKCGEFFEKYNCKLGAKWNNPDYPHVQWGKCAKSPILAPLLYIEGGNERVWKAVGAA